MNIKKNKTLSPCNSAGHKFKILKMCAKDVATHDQVGPTFSIFRLAGMTYHRGGNPKLFSIWTRLSLGQRAIPRLDLDLSCLYSLASFIY